MAAAVLAVMPAVDAFAAETPVFPYFNENDVNGRVIVTLPEGLAAKVSITFDSPEGKAEPYYLTDLAENTSATFDIEGRDYNLDDYRIYNLTVAPEGMSVSPYTVSFTVPDGDDNPDSFKEYKYTFLVDDIVSEKDWDSSLDGGEHTITYHLKSFTLGDVNEDGKVDAKDASRVLVYYSAASTGASASAGGTASSAVRKASSANCTFCELLVSLSWTVPQFGQKLISSPSCAPQL